MSGYDPYEPDEDALDDRRASQLQPEDTLEDRGVDDVLDEGYSPPDRPRGVTAKGTTAAGELDGETLEERLAQEEPEVQPEPPYVDEEDPAEREVGHQRSGRLVAPDEGFGEDTEASLIAEDVGIDGAGASAEEAAVHDIAEDDEAF